MKERNHSRFSMFVEKIVLADSFEQAFSAFEKQIQELGFSGALYAYIPALSLDTNFSKEPVYHYSDTYSPDYLIHYMEENYYRNDPIVKAMKSGFTESLDWSTELKKGRMNEAEEKVIIIAQEDYQMIHGLTIPTLSGNQGVACISVISQDSQLHYQLVQQNHLKELQLSSKILHGAVMANGFHIQKFIQPLIADLNATERAFLRKLTEGKKFKQIAAELGLKEKYMDKVIRHVREKLSLDKGESGTIITREQLIFYAGQLNIINLF